MTQSSFYGDTPNYATTYPTQNDPNTNPANGNQSAPSSFYPNGGQYAQSDPVAAAASASQAAASAAAALASQTAAGTSATNAASSATAAAGSASAASTSATNAASSATAASGSASAASTSATNAANSATSVSGSASTASTQATNASNSATAASTSATNAASSATSASTSATNAANSASSAATSATNAASAVQAAAGTVTPAMDGAAAVGTSTKWAHEDHVHPTDTSRAPLASPTFTGTPAAPTATAGTNTTQLATTAFVQAALGNAGAWSNTYLSKTAAYTVATTDAGKTIGLSGTACYTLTLNAASTYAANFAIVLVNEDSGRAKIISLNGATSYLWPGQSVMVFNDNNTWRTLGQPVRWRVGGLIFYVDPTNGNDNNDGLAAGTGNAFQTIGRAVNVLYQQIDCNNSQPLVYVLAGSTVFETINIFGQLTGYNVFGIMGNGGQFTWKPASSSSACCVQIGDNAEVMFANVYFDSNGTGNGNYAHIYGHQYGVVDIGFNSTGGVTMGSANGTRAVFWDYNGQINVNLPVTYTGAFGNIFQINDTTLNLNGAQTASGISSVSRFIYATLASRVDVQGNVTTSGTFTGISASYANDGAIIRNAGGGVLPGGTPTTANGGIYSTAL